MSDAFWRRDNADIRKKLDTELLTINGLEVHRLRIQSNNRALSLRFEDTGTGTAYLGRAEIGSSTTDPVWEIRQLLTTGGNIIILWADGDALFNKSWDARTGYSYS